MKLNQKKINKKTLREAVKAIVLKKEKAKKKALSIQRHF